MQTQMATKTKFLHIVSQERVKIGSMYKKRFWYLLYLVGVSLAGLILIGWGIYSLSSYEPRLRYLLLLLFAAIAQIMTTSLPVSEKAGITYDIGGAVSIATIPFYGLPGAALMIALSSLSMWLVKSSDETTWKRSWRQLFFNLGMHSLSIVLSGMIYFGLRNLLVPITFTAVSAVVPWFIAGFAYGQFNIWILIGILRLQHGAEIYPWEIWRENRWALAIDAIVMIVGGGFLAFALDKYDLIAVGVFFLPIFLSSFAFRIYIRQMRTHMDNLENIVTERTQELAELMKEKDAFLAVLTHDMKTPLTTIGLYSDILIRQPDITLKKPYIPQVIRNNQQALTEMVNNILDLEKLQVGGSMPLERTSFDLVPSLEYLTESLSAQADKKKITVEHHFAVSPLMLSGDQKQLERVFQNLLSNAIKYTPEGGRVCIEALLEEGKALIRVQDTGYGIPAEDLPFIFDRFRRVVKHKKVATGTGLGLAIVKAIVEAHDGVISVSSQEENGSEFLVHLPL